MELQKESSRLKQLAEESIEIADRLEAIVTEAQDAAEDAANSSKAITKLLLMNPGKWPLEIVNAELVATNADLVANATANSAYDAHSALRNAVAESREALKAVVDAQAAIDNAPTNSD